jgi:dihydrolipoamide dehydrogenase
MLVIPGLVPGIQAFASSGACRDMDPGDKRRDDKPKSSEMPYDMIIIGTGPGGYVCAIRAAQLGRKVAVVEKRATHGGTCLNVGCIPSKALLHASEAYEEAAHDFAGMGIEVKPKLDLAKMLAFKDQGVKGNVDGVAFLLKKNKIDAIQGAATILDPGKVGVALANGDKQRLEAKSIVIATGSDVAQLPGVAINEQSIVSSTGALTLAKVPKRLLVIGAGVIGLELGSVWRRLGSEVLVVEFLDRILPGVDAEVARTAQRILMKQGMSFKLSSKVTGVARNAANHKVTIEPAAGGEPVSVEADVVLVAIGRVPYTEGLGLEAAGVKLDNKRRILVDDRFQTSAAGIYAIGDVIAGPMLAHKAEDEGIAVAEILAGQAGHVNHDVIPNVIYTFPEIACVGRSEEELKAAGVAYRSGKFPFTANARAKVNKTTDGFVKILADAATDRILGVHIIAAAASEMIAEVAVIMEFGGSAEDLARTCHAHPTLTEAVREAALAVDKRAIHM